MESLLSRLWKFLDWGKRRLLRAAGYYSVVYQPQAILDQPQLPDPTTA
jgi:hypothetical protein